jgi:hypothetical protein
MASKVCRPRSYTGQWGFTPHHARVEAGARVERLHEQDPDTVLANLVVHGLGVALDRVLGRHIAGHEGLRREIRRPTTC